MRRHNSSGTKLTFARSGMTIPEEMHSGKVTDAFVAIAVPLLEGRVAKAIQKYLK